MVPTLNPILKLVLLLAIMSDLCIERGTSVSRRKHAVTCDAWNVGSIVCAIQVRLIIMLFK